VWVDVVGGGLIIVHALFLLFWFLVSLDHYRTYLLWKFPAIFQNLILAGNLDLISLPAPLRARTARFPQPTI
jgi:hypothetical protein